MEYRKIEFAGVPDSIYSLSNLIIHGSGTGTPSECEDDISDVSCGQKTIFDRLKTNNENSHNYSNIDTETVSDKKSHQRHSSLMFSFDADAMKNCSLRNSEGKD